MEFSSPLAAMHAPSTHTWGCRRDVPSSRFLHAGSNYGQQNFNFRDLSMQNTTKDYFATRTQQRGSSPTASLAADLSTNFHIDQSPQMPTPRRSLFANDAPFQFPNREFLVTPPVEHEGATTPPIPDSSPAIDIMDISPQLHHKHPLFVAKVILASPTPPSPRTTPRGDEEMTDCTEQTPTAPPPPRMDFGATLALPERRRPSMPRPGLMKSKTFTAPSATSHPAKQSLLPAFQFGNTATSLTSASTTSLIDTISESPVENNNSFFPTLANVSGPRRPSLGCGARVNGSPMGGVAKKSNVIAVRPRKQVRRSLSMFQHPDDVMKETEDYEPPVPALQSPNDVDTEYKHKLPHFLPDEPDSLPRIQQDTLINVINGQYNSYYDKIMVIDCRFEYEYNGGHIDSASNFNDKEVLAKALFDEPLPPRTLLILHCEYSVHRAPRMAKFVRQRDRAINDFQYPALSYPEMYILEGGYHQFFKQHRDKCFPQNYIEMEHKDHEHACEKGMGKLKQRAKLSRAKTFAFGQQTCQMEDSPTSNVMGRMGVRSFSALEMHDISPMLARQATRRLATAS